MVYEWILCVVKGLLDQIFSVNIDYGVKEGHIWRHYSYLAETNRTETVVT